MWGTDKDTKCVFANANKVHLLVRSQREREEREKERRRGGRGGRGYPSLSRTATISGAAKRSLDALI